MPLPDEKKIQRGRALDRIRSSLPGGSWGPIETVGRERQKRARRSEDPGAEEEKSRQHQSNWPGAVLHLQWYSTTATEYLSRALSVIHSPTSTQGR